MLAAADQTNETLKDGKAQKKRKKKKRFECEVNINMKTKNNKKNVMSTELQRDNKKISKGQMMYEICTVQ